MLLLLLLPAVPPLLEELRVQIYHAIAIKTTAAPTAIPTIAPIESRPPAVAALASNTLVVFVVDVRVVDVVAMVVDVYDLVIDVAVVVVNVVDVVVVVAVAVVVVVLVVVVEVVTLVVVVVPVVDVVVCVASQMYSLFSSQPTFTQVGAKLPQTNTFVQLPHLSSVLGLGPLFDQLWNTPSPSTLPHFTPSP